MVEDEDVSALAEEVRHEFADVYEALGMIFAEVRSLRGDLVKQRRTVLRAAWCFRRARSRMTKTVRERLLYVFGGLGIGVAIMSGAPAWRSILRGFLTLIGI